MIFKKMFTVIKKILRLQSFVFGVLIGAVSLATFQHLKNRTNQDESYKNAWKSIEDWESYHENKWKNWEKKWKKKWNKWGRQVRTPVERILEAKKFVYVYCENCLSQEIMNALLGAVNRGVKVKVLLVEDCWITQEKIKNLINLGLEIRMTKKVYRDLRTLLLIDQDTVCIVYGDRSFSSFNGRYNTTNQKMLAWWDYEWENASNC